MKQHYIYLTTNNINGMKYIGKHYGELDDPYLGSGKILKRAITKYGKENFTKSILSISINDEKNTILLCTMPQQILYFIIFMKEVAEEIPLPSTPKKRKSL